MKKLKYILNDFRWIKALFSPFKPFTVRWYIGKTQIGVPYFFPRKWVKATPTLARKAATEAIELEKRYNEMNPNYARKIKPFNEIYNEKMRYQYPIPLKVGFSYCGLGWKTKWDQFDIRYEYGPVLSFVFFGYQIAAMVGHKDPDHYWEAWLCYEYMTDKTKSKRERIIECRKKCPQTWTRTESDGTRVTTDYYNRILKQKYLK